MRLKTVVIALIFSLVFVVARASYADTLTMTGLSGQTDDGEYVDPYIFKLTARTAPPATWICRASTMIATSTLNSPGM